MALKGRPVAQATTRNDMPKTHTITTDDLAMATFLNLEGQNHRELRMKDRRSAEWVFIGNGDLTVLAEEYQRGEAAVEPLEFSRKLREVRDELYQFMKKNRRG